MTGRAALVLIGFAVGASAAGPPPVGPDTTVATGPLDPEGYVDYAAAINKNLRGDAPTPKENGFVRLVEHAYVEDWDPDHLLQLTELTGSELVAVVDEPFVIFEQFGAASGDIPADAVADFDRALEAGHWDETRTPLTAAWLDAMDPALDGIVGALRLPGWYCPLVPRGHDAPVLASLLPELRLMRGIGRALLLRGCRALNDRDPGPAIEDYAALRVLAERCSLGPTQLGGLVAISIDGFARTLLEKILSHGGLTRPQFDRLNALSAIRRRSLADVIDRDERLIAIDLLTRSARRAGALIEGLELMQLPEEKAWLEADADRVVSDPRYDLAAGLRGLNFLFDALSGDEGPETLREAFSRAERFEKQLDARRPNKTAERWIAAFPGPAASDKELARASDAVLRLLTHRLMSGMAQSLATDEAADANRQRRGPRAGLVSAGSRSLPRKSGATGADLSADAARRSRDTSAASLPR